MDSSLFKIEIVGFDAHGKFLLTGEYAVLDNVDALAIPLKLDQRLNITPREDQMIHWKSYNADGKLWFQDTFSLENIIDSRFKGDQGVASKLIQILRIALNLVGKRNFSTGFDAVTTLDFDRKSGMGTSSTMISMVARWLGCDPFELQFECFGGSGYDIACAESETAIVYNYQGGLPRTFPITYRPKFTDQLFFIYLNQKQNSRDSIASFDSKNLTVELRHSLNEMPKRFLETEDDLQAFEVVIAEHEKIIASLIGATPVKERLFPDYKGAIKSLGGWGGDYVLATGTLDSMNYFKSKGYNEIYNWDEIVLSR